MPAGRNRPKRTGKSTSTDQVNSRSSVSLQLEKKTPNPKPSKRKVTRTFRREKHLTNRHGGTREDVREPQSSEGTIESDLSDCLSDAPDMSPGNGHWEVAGVIGEKPGYFLVDWEGTDDKGRPWKPTWVSLLMQLHHVKCS